MDAYTHGHADPVLQSHRRWLASAVELAEVAEAWRRWRDADDGWLGMMHGELLVCC